MKTPHTIFNKKFEPLFREGLQGLDDETLIYIMKQAEDVLFDRLWGMRTSTFIRDLKARRFIEKGRSILTVKNELSKGDYAITVCSPEHSSVKFDLCMTAPDPSSKVKQIRILFSRRDWLRIVGL